MWVGATWRLVRFDRSGGDYFKLEKGRGRERRGLTLGYVSRSAAERALATVQAAEDADAVDRVVRLYEKDREKALRHLTADEGERLAGELEPDYGAMRLCDYYEKHFKEARAAGRPRSWLQEERHWKKLLEGIGDVPLRKVDEFVLADHLDALTVSRGERAGEAASGTTKRLHRACLQALLKRAYRRRHTSRRCRTSRCSQSRGSRGPCGRSRTRSRSRELVKLMNAATEPRYRALFAVGAGQGLRPSELVALDWSDVDWNVPTLRIRGKKTEASADVIPLTPLAHRELKKWWVKCRKPKQGVIFPSDTGEAYRSSSAYKKPLETAAKRAKLGRDVYPYLLRDSFATIAWTVGIEKDIARRVLRHTDERMLDRVYCRPPPQDMVDGLAAFET